MNTVSPWVPQEHSLLALNANKHVLVEKPMGINTQETEEIIRVAKEKVGLYNMSLEVHDVFSVWIRLICTVQNLFLMEGMWTRFFPAVRKARQLIKEGAIGKVCAGNLTLLFVVVFTLLECDV